MNHLSENVDTFTNFAEQLRMVHEAQDPETVCIPDLQQWMQYWNDEESEAANLRNIRHWISRARKNN
ncbi:MAG TPA: hypothetical protein VHL14_11450 [Steroidobacteraceae bacterium]|nr:hypothetical protein [Steroidobacteraceae bacterium]